MIATIQAKELKRAIGRVCAGMSVAPKSDTNQYARLEIVHLSRSRAALQLEGGHYGNCACVSEDGAQWKIRVGAEDVGGDEGGGTFAAMQDLKAAAKMLHDGSVEVAIDGKGHGVTIRWKSGSEEHKFAPIAIRGMENFEGCDRVRGAGEEKIVLTMRQGELVETIAKALSIAKNTSGLTTGRLDAVAICRGNIVGCDGYRYYRRELDGVEPFQALEKDVMAIDTANIRYLEKVAGRAWSEFPMSVSIGREKGGSAFVATFRGEDFEYVARVSGKGYIDIDRYVINEEESTRGVKMMVGKSELMSSVEFLAATIPPKEKGKIYMAYDAEREEMGMCVLPEEDAGGCGGSYRGISARDFRMGARSVEIKAASADFLKQIGKLIDGESVEIRAAERHNGPTIFRSGDEVYFLLPVNYIFGEPKEKEERKRKIADAIGEAAREYHGAA